VTSPFEGGEALNKRNHPVDPDLSFDSLHHTLGHGATQAAPGNHYHNIEEIRGFEETTVLTDHQQLTNRTPDNAHSQYVLDKGDTMTGPLYINSTDYSKGTPLIIRRDTYPEIKLFKTSSPAGAGHEWRIYISGNSTDVNPSLSIASAYNNVVMKTFRLNAQSGTLELAGDPTANMHAVTRQYLDDSVPLTGSFNVAVVAAGATTGAYNITFPAGRFSTAPVVMISVGNSRLTGMIASLSTTGATLNFSNWSPAATPGTATCWWTAIPSKATATLLPAGEEEDVEE